MIDLTALGIRTFEVKVKRENGDVITLNLSEPSIQTVETIEKQRVSDAESTAHVLCMILNSNTENVYFTEAYIKSAFTRTQAVRVVREYMAWIYEVEQNPN